MYIDLGAGGGVVEGADMVWAVAAVAARRVAASSGLSMAGSGETMRMILADVDFGGRLRLGNLRLGGAGGDEALAQTEEGKFDEFGCDDA